MGAGFDLVIVPSEDIIFLVEQNISVLHAIHICQHLNKFWNYFRWTSKTRVVTEGLNISFGKVIACFKYRFGEKANAPTIDFGRRISKKMLS